MGYQLHFSETATYYTEAQDSKMSICVKLYTSIFICDYSVCTSLKQITQNVNIKEAGYKAQIYYTIQHTTRVTFCTKMP